MTAYFQPPSVKKICAQPDFAKISAILVKIAPISVPPYIKGVVCSRTPASPQAPRREPAAGLETRLMPRMTALPPHTEATAAEIAAMISPGMEPLSALAAGAAGLAAGAGAALAAGAFGAAGLPFFLLLMLSKILPSSVMMRHRATSIAKTSVMLVSTTVPSLASRARRARLGMDDPPLNGSSPR